MKRKMVGTFRSTFIGKSIFFILLLLFSATFFLIGCGGGGGSGEDDGTGKGTGGGSQDFIIPSTTKVLYDTTMQLLSSISDDGRVYTFEQETADLNELSPGDVIVSGVTSTTPYGMLRMVTSVSNSDGQVIVYTEDATIEDAIQKGVIEANYDLVADDIQNAVALQRGVHWQRNMDEADEPLILQAIDLVIYDADENEETTDDQIRADGEIRIDTGFNFIMKIDDYQLKELTFTNTTTESAQLDLTADISLIDWEEHKEIWRHTFTPITIWVSWFPVVITPVLTVNVGCTGEVSVGMSAGISQNATLTAGVSYDNGQWVPVSEFSNEITNDPVTISAQANARGYAGPKLALLLYGVTGPNGEIQAYLDLAADPYAEPWWELYGGLDVSLGVSAKIIGHNIVNYSEKVIDYRLFLAQADTPIIPDGRIAGVVRDAANGNSLEDAEVIVYESGSIIADRLTSSSGTYDILVPSGNGYDVEFSKPGYLTTYYYNISVDPETTTNLEPVLQIDTSYSGTGDLSGKIYNALDGTGVSGLTVQLREGINVKSGSIYDTTTTVSGGSYNFTDLDAGHYTAEVTATGFITTFFTVVCLGGIETTNQDASITPVLSPGETRIVLTWGEDPSDLDSHLTGPIPGTSNRFHIYFANKGSSNSSPFADLDLDDTTSYGPETATIYQQFEGIYRYSVHNYTNKSSTNSLALSESAAQVRVYRGSDLVATFNVPTEQGGTLWTVFELDGDTITPINTMTYESGSGNVQRANINLLYTEDTVLFSNLPSK